VRAPFVRWWWWWWWWWYAVHRGDDHHGVGFFEIRPIVLPDINGVIGSRLIELYASSSSSSLSERVWKGSHRKRRQSWRGRVARRGRDGAAGSHRGCIDYDVIHFASFKKGFNQIPSMSICRLRTTAYYYYYYYYVIVHAATVRFKDELRRSATFLYTYKYIDKIGFILLYKISQLSSKASATMATPDWIEWT